MLHPYLPAKVIGPLSPSPMDPRSSNERAIYTKWATKQGTVLLFGLNQPGQSEDITKIDHDQA